MSMVKKQLQCGDNTVLILDSAPPANWKKDIRIGNDVFETEIAYDLPNAIAVKAKGDFVGKQIEYL